MKFKSLLKIILIPLTLILIIIVTIVGDMKMAQYRAQNFCEVAGDSKTAQEIKVLLTQTKGYKNTIFLENTINIQFPQFLPEYYACTIHLNDYGKSISYSVDHYD